MWLGETKCSRVNVFSWKPASWFEESNKCRPYFSVMKNNCNRNADPNPDRQPNCPKTLTSQVEEYPPPPLQHQPDDSMMGTWTGASVVGEYLHALFAILAQRHIPTSYKYMETPWRWAAVHPPLRVPERGCDTHKPRSKVPGGLMFHILSWGCRKSIGWADMWLGWAY